jgi:hypothetical protein
LLVGLAARLGLDYEGLCRRRILHLITPDEARALAARGLDLEYHTHRHRVFRDRGRMRAELDDNRRRLEAYSANTPWLTGAAALLPKRAQAMYAQPVDAT